MDVVITFHRDRISAGRIQQEIEGLGRRCVAMKCAVDVRRQVDRVVRDVVRSFGRIDLLVNNAGIWTEGRIGEMPESVWNETIAVNLNGTFLFTNAVVPVMRRQSSGRIVNISSTAGQRGEAFHSHYAASKGAVIAFTKSIGPELAPEGIFVNCVAPGWVETDMSADVLRDPVQRTRIEESIPRGRAATPEDVAGAVLFLASDLSAHLVGSTISVNGGSVLSN
jgi:3-oxoacyl-[acyl-carrier protein] reductase